MIDRDALKKIEQQNYCQMCLAVGASSAWAIWEVGVAKWIAVLGVIHILEYS